MSVADIRTTYQKGVLLEESVAPTPLEQFTRWFDEALAAHVVEPTAMTLASVDQHGRPSARIVLLKGFDERGFVFFTNYESRKGREILANPHASLLFFWPALERQVRIEGEVTQVAGDESDAYYNSRPLGSRIGAWASPQSRPITHDELEARTRQFTESLGEHPPRPPHWGGFRLRPDYLEFWQGRPSRLHDRLVFRRTGHDQWERERLAP
ncbi:MAG TPA: pyridoxamine 5'-phosphate oxidase [Burkholderiaceae bacterium]|nr:pyridoxamine 5'-phosphate oxidase [Burkholderiaceae bacterium]